jgi:23S rRNA (uracil1939-C5)-methyltransferase
MELEVEIARLGAQADGVADGPGGPIFVPFTLPGERVRIAVEPDTNRADLLDVLTPNPDRIEPVCPHFGVCGSCALQHMEAKAYLCWKRDQVIAALRSRGLDADVEEVRPVPLGTRRRASLALGHHKTGGAFGYHRARSHGPNRCHGLPRSVAAHRCGPAQAQSGTRLLGRKARSQRECHRNQ